MLKGGWTDFFIIKLRIGERNVFVLIITYKYNIYFAALHSLKLDAKIEGGHSLMTKSSLAVVSFRHNGFHVCSGVFSSQETVSTSSECGEKLIAFRSTSKNSVVAVFGETARTIRSIMLLSTPDNGTPSIAALIVGLSISSIY